MQNRVEINTDIAIDDDQEDLFEHYQFLVDKGQTPLRIDKFLMHKIQNASRTKIQAAIKNNAVLVSKSSVKANYKIKPLDNISIVLPYPPRDTAIYPEKMDLNITYEDDFMCIVNKSANVVVHPGFNNYTGTLVHGLLYHFNKATLPEIKVPALLAHRIDKNTSGLLVIGKDENTLAHLAKQFFDHSIQRKYLAIVWGNFEENKGTINANLERDPKDRKRRSVPKDATLGKHAITHYEVIANYHFCSLISCTLETGRTHQIRAHMAHVGHPIFNDDVYGGDKILKGSQHSKFKQFILNCFQLMPRQALHAKSLGFIHPKSKKNVYFETELPQDFSALLSKISEYANHF